MSALNLSRVAYGCTQVSELEARLQSMADGQGRFSVTTRNKPKRAEELIGGCVYYIVKHMLMARVEITAIESDDKGYHHIICKLPVQRVRSTPKRAHQGWRYLSAEDAPEVISSEEAENDLPPHLLRELSALKLI